jgi:Ca2+-dependent lipid-binding protein
VGIATDIDDGKPDDYDLPPPTAAGAIALTNGVVGQTSTANRIAPEQERWAADKTGWAPRFGDGMTATEREDTSTLLDHQTFLEGRLDEKFFGDWYHNTAVIIFACLSSWVVALFGGGLGWVFIIMATCGTYYRTSLRRVRRNFRDDISRELAKTRPEQDTESLEWMNSFLTKFWPIYAPNLAESVILSVDQVLSTSTPTFLDSMRLKTFILGTKAPRMEHVRTYPKTEDDIVMMDWKFSFTPTDTMDLTARQLKNKINPKVVLEIRIGKAMISKVMDIIVEDFCFSGLMRLKIKLQLAFPFVEKIDMCFMERPEIDYVCKPLGGDTFGFDINFIPGLETFIKEQIHANLSPIMYNPAVFPIEIAKMLSGNPIDQAVGVVAVTLHGALGLQNTDKFSGTPDPYAVLSLNGRDELGRTKTITENANPRWNETLYIIITNFTDTLTMTVFDFNDVRKDKELGVAHFTLDKVEDIHEHESLQLEVLSNGKPRGLVQADVRFFPVLGGVKMPDGTEQPPPESNTGIARITVEQAEDLDGTKSLVGRLSPYAVLLLNGKEIHVTKKLKSTNNPIFPDASKSVLVTDRKKARIGLVIKDDRDLTTDPIIGSYQIKADDLLTLMHNGQEWFNLANSTTGRVKLALDWKPVALSGIAGGSGGYITPIGVMRIHFQSARDLRNLETIGKSDPYARVLLSGIQQARTVTFTNELNPTWDEVVYVPMHSPNERLTLEVMDEEARGKDRSLGLIEIPASAYIKESEEGGYEVHDSKIPVSGGLQMNAKGAPKGTLNYTVSFYPTLNVVDPEEEEEERKAAEELAAKGQTQGHSKTASVASAVSRPSIESKTSLEEAGKTNLESKLTNGDTMPEEKQQPKIRIGAEDLGKYGKSGALRGSFHTNKYLESGLIIFNIIEGTFAHPNCQLEFLMDDQTFPSYTTSKARSKIHQFGETGDAFVRELDMSKITMRLTEKADTKGINEDEDHVIAKLQGQTLPTLQRCLYTPTELTLKSPDGASDRVTVKLRYIPVKMTLDPSESMNNMGTLRVDVLDATELPAADRNGYSDPFCRFKYNGKEVYKTKTQKKTLHPAWNEYFEIPVTSRTAADFKCEVYDWDMGETDDFLGATSLNLQVLEPFQPQELTYKLDGKSGVVRLKMLFKPSYVTRSRQGSATFNTGTFAVAGKVVGAPVKGVGKLGGGVAKGAGLLRRGFTNRGSKNEAMDLNGGMNGDSGSTPAASPQSTPARAAAIMDGVGTPMTPHSRTKSSGNGSVHGGTPAKAENGTVEMTVVSATGYPSGADVRVTVKMLGAKAKEVHKTKAVKSSSGVAEFSESFKATCAADTQFQVSVVDHHTFGGSKDLGEAMFFASDQGSGAEQTVSAGAGKVLLKTGFTAFGAEYAESLKPSVSGRESPDSKRESRRSFFSRRDVSGKTPATEAS